MPLVDTPNQFGDSTLTPEEAASACGPAAAVAFARANGRNPTLREALDLAKKVGWTAAGGMNGIANQKRLLDAMGLASDLDTSGNAAAIRRRVQGGQDAIVSTPIHYYVVDAVDDQGRVHVGQSGLARRGGSEWMRLEDIAARDGGINGALYQTAADDGRDGGVRYGTMLAGEPTDAGDPTVRVYRGGQEIDPNTPGLESQQPGGAGMDSVGDRPPSEFEPPSSAGGARGPITRADRMRAQIDELTRQRRALDAQLTALSQPGPDETAVAHLGEVDPAERQRAENARLNRVARWQDVRQQAVALDAAIRGVQTDLANDPDAKAAPQPGTAIERIVTLPNGTKVKRSYQRDPTTGTYQAVPGLPDEPVATGAGNKTVVNRNGKAYIYDADTGTFTPAAGLPDESTRTTHAIGRRLVTLDQQGNVVSSVDFTTPEEAAQAQLNLQKGQLDIQKAQRDLLPQALQVMQGLHETITQLQGMYEKGQIELPEMNAYVQLAKDAANAQLRGTTPAEEAAATARARHEDQTLGMNLLNQRLVSGTGLANTLMSSALGPNIMLRPGQTSLGVDPLASLGPLLNQLGGGADIPGYARGLLMGGQNPPPPQGAAHAGL